MRGFGQFCPIAKTLEIIGTRWTPLILRELLAGGRHFSDIQQGVPLISRSLLAQRLKELEQDGLITATEKPNGRGHEYTLTRAGAAVRPILEALSDWGVHHAQDHIRPEDCDPWMLFLGIRRHCDLDPLPDRRFVIRFELSNVPASRRGVTTWWLVWDDAELDVCVTNPGFQVDVVVRSPIDVLVKVWMGHFGLAEATASGAICLDGGAAARKILIAMFGFKREPDPKTFQIAFS